MLPQTLVARVVGILIIGAIIGGVLMSIGTAIAETGEGIMDFMGTEEHIEIEDKHTFVSASRYVYDRAFDCDKVDDNTYYGLENTDYGKNPRCIGVSGTLMASIRGNFLGGDTGGDMEGRNSRITFEIPEDIEKDKIPLRSDYIYTDDEKLDEEIGGDRNLGSSEVSLRGFSEYMGYYDRIEEEVDCEGTLSGNLNDAGGPEYFFAIDTFENMNRINAYGEAEEIGDTDMPLYCDTDFFGVSEYLYQVQADSKIDGEDGHFELALCPGDEGYIQVNKEYPDNDGEARVDRVYPFIELTRLGEDCFESESDDEFDEEIAPYDGPHIGQQLHVRADESFWPDLETRRFTGELNLRGGEEPEEDKETHRASLDLQEDECQIYYRDRNRGLAWSGTTVKGYEIGTVLQKTQTSFEDEDLPYSSIDEDNVRSDASDLISTMMFSQDQHMSDSTAGEIRVSTQQGNSINKMYGDLLCANPEDKDYAEWHLCDEGLDEDLWQMEDLGKECQPTVGVWSTLDESPEDCDEGEIYCEEQEACWDEEVYDEQICEGV